MPHIIRTSDRGTFRSCRQKWDFTSKMRLNYEPVTSMHYFEFGTAIHGGMEVWYKPETWFAPREMVLQLAVDEFRRINRKQMLAYKDSNGLIPDEKREEYTEREQLGVGMLEHYSLWSKTKDRFIPKYAEIEFEVPVLLPNTIDAFNNLPEDFDGQTYGELESGDTIDQLMYKPKGDLWYIPVVYQGRIDLIVEADDGTLWLIDHKTTSRMDSIEWVDKDPQVSSYVWAANQMEIPVEGFIMNQLKKAAPEKPSVLQNPRKGRKLSVSKSQATTYELFMEAIHEAAEPVELYEDILQYLKISSDENYFRRIEVHRTPTEIEYAGTKIFQEAIDMLGDPYIYPNPSQWNCRGCPFNVPCTARMDGSDYMFILDNEALYRNRSKNGPKQVESEGLPQDQTSRGFVGPGGY